MQKATNKNILQNAQNLLNYLCGAAGNKIITGQHTQTNFMEETEYIKKVTGKVPKLMGFELLAYSPNINYDDASEECLTEVKENKDTLNTALKIAETTDSIITFTFHWFSPLGGRDKSFYAKNTNFDPRKILVKDSEECKAFYSDMDKIAAELKIFCDKEIPVLWRPFHESDGTWFWWGSQGEETARELYKLMYDYYVNVHHLNNLLWVWNCRTRAGYPGDEFVDVISVDIYLPEYRSTDYREDYEKLINETTKNKVCALAEVGYMPDVKVLEETKTPWAYYMTWSKEFCMGEKYNSEKLLKEMYSSDHAITQ